MNQNETEYNEIDTIFCAIADMETEYRCVYINGAHDEKLLRGVILNYASDRIIFYNKQYNKVWHIRQRDIRLLEPT